MISDSSVSARNKHGAAFFIQISENILCSSARSKAVSLQYSPAPVNSPAPVQSPAPVSTGRWNGHITIEDETSEEGWLFSSQLANISYFLRLLFQASIVQADYKLAVKTYIVLPFFLLTRISQLVYLQFRSRNRRCFGCHRQKTVHKSSATNSRTLQTEYLRDRNRCSIKRTIFVGGTKGDGGAICLYAFVCRF